MSRRAGTKEVGMKMVMVGESGVGKSSITLAFTEHVFDPNLPPTIGCEFRVKTLTIDDDVENVHVDTNAGEVDDDGFATPHDIDEEDGGNTSKTQRGTGSKSRTQGPVPVYLQIWDTAGQERFRALGTRFYRGAHAIGLVYDVNEPNSFHNLQWWLDDVRNRIEDTDVQTLRAPQLGSRVPINVYREDVVLLLIGNKVDACEGKTMAVDPADARRFARENRMLFALTSAKTEVGIEQAFDEVAREVYAKYKRRQAQQGGEFEDPSGDNGGGGDADKKRIFFNQALNRRGGKVGNDGGGCC